MSTIDTYQRLPLSQIVIRRLERQRKVISTVGLKESIARFGVLHPVIIDQDCVLIAGERRVTASLELGLPDIPVRYVSELSQKERLLIELEENTRRVDITWQEQVDAISRLHALFCEMQPGWTMHKTGEEIGLSPSVLSLYLSVAGAAKERPQLLEAQTVRQAYNTVVRYNQRKESEVLEDVLSAAGFANLSPQKEEPVSSPILTEDFLKWLPSYEGKKFNFIHCDFPYGIKVFAGPQGAIAQQHVYDDSPEVYWELLETFCLGLSKIMSWSGHLMFWYSAKQRQKTLEMFERLCPQLTFYPYDLVWFKSCNTGISSHPQHFPRHVHETALLAYSGNKNIVKIVADTYAAPTAREWHPSTKPEPMLRHFFSMLVDDTTNMLDPTCGGGSALRAAVSLGANSILGLEKDEEHATAAREAFSKFLKLEKASAQAKEVLF